MAQVELVSMVIVHINNGLSLVERHELQEI